MEQVFNLAYSTDQGLRELLASVSEHRCVTSGSGVGVLKASLLDRQEHGARLLSDEAQRLFAGDVTAVFRGG